MNRSGIIRVIAELYPKMHKKQVERLVKVIFTSMSDKIAFGERIEIRGFGCFSLKYRAAGTVRNPRHGVSIESTERHVVYFRAGKELKERVDVCD